MTRALRTHALGVLLALTVPLAAGCGAGAQDSDADSAADRSRSEGAAAHDGEEQRRRQGVKFSACMREHGVPEFPDPDRSGELTIDAIANDTSIEIDGPAWNTAIGACRALQPSGFTGTARTDEQQNGALAFAKCMREHGVEDFPDPVNGQPLVDTRRIPSSNAEGGMAILDAAMEQCGTAAEAAGARP